MSKKPPKGRSLAERNPDLAKQWHPDNEKTAKDVFPFTDEKYWWKCPEGDKWEDSTRNRSRGSTCTVCRSIAITHPHLAEEWHPTFNGDKKPEDFTAGMHEKIWWKCPKYPEDPEADDHVWYSTIKSRATGNESGCPICAGKKVVPSNCLAKTRDDIAKQWHPTFNGDKKPEDYTAGSDVMIWWKCPKAIDHVWYSTIKNRTKEGRCCPLCINRRWPVSSTSLKKTHPKLAKEWHPTKNLYEETELFPIGKLEDIMRPCLYDENHKWTDTINARARLLKLYSHFDFFNYKGDTTLSKEWEPTKYKRPEHFTSGSNEEILWKCRFDKHKVWPAQIKSRARKDNPRGCPDCVPPSTEEFQIFFELKTIWKDAVNGYKEKFDRGEFDFYIPKLSLVIDYDGNRWHNKKNNIERDRTKTKKFKDNKYNVFRIREQDNEFKLDNITDNDITIDKYQKDKIKTIVDKVLINIMNMFPDELDAKKITSINAYIDKPGLRNSKKCDEELRRRNDKRFNKDQEDNKKP